MRTNDCSSIENEDSGIESRCFVWQGERVSTDGVRMTGDASAAERGRFSSKPATAEDEAELMPWKYFELDDKGSMFYIRGLEDVAETDGLFDAVDAEGDPEPEEKEDENVE